MVLSLVASGEGPRLGLQGTYVVVQWGQGTAESLHGKLGKSAREGKETTNEGVGKRPPWVKSESP